MLSCVACATCCFSVCLYGNHEATPGEQTSGALNYYVICRIATIQAMSGWQFDPFFLQTDDPSQKNTLLVLKFLPFMIGWFSLSVPSGLSIYWYVHLLLVV